MSDLIWIILSGGTAAIWLFVGITTIRKKEYLGIEKYIISPIAFLFAYFLIQELSAQEFHGGVTNIIWYPINWALAWLLKTHIFLVEHAKDYEQNHAWALVTVNGVFKDCSPIYEEKFLKPYGLTLEEVKNVHIEDFLGVDVAAYYIEKYYYVQMSNQPEVFYEDIYNHELEQEIKHFVTVEPNLNRKGVTEVVVRVFNPISEIIEYKR